jgi:hypothetical protein
MGFSGKTRDAFASSQSPNRFSTGAARACRSATIRATLMQQPLAA